MPVAGRDRLVASGTRGASRTHVRFRRANEDLLRRAELLEELGDLTELVPLLCECADPRCTRVLRLKPEEFEEIRLLVERYGGVQYAQARAQDYASGAKEALAVFPDGEDKETLLLVADYVVDRDK